MGFPGAKMVKNLPAMRETWVQSLGWKDPLEKGMAIYSSILAWRIPWTRGAWQATVHGVAKSRTGLLFTNNAQKVLVLPYPLSQGLDIIISKTLLF